jgi:isoquinoline 1-oxidoreductase subunit beta
MSEIIGEKPKRKGVKRRAFLIGSAAVAGAGVFAIGWQDRSALKKAIALTKKGDDASFAGWMKIAPDDTVTLYSPHIDFGQGSQTTLVQMLAEELDVDMAKVVLEMAPADLAFANTTLARSFLGMLSGQERVMESLPTAMIGAIARTLEMQLTGGSSAVRFTGQRGMRVLGAATREAMIAEAAARLAVPASELATANGIVSHAKSGKTLRYGELAAAAAQRTLSTEPTLKDKAQWRYIGKPVPRRDIPARVDGTAQYGIDFSVPDMRVATIAMAPVRDGRLERVDPKPAMSIPGVEKVVQLDDAVIVVAKGYWQAKKGLDALSPTFSDGGHGGISTASIFAEQEKLNAGGKALAAPAGAKLVTANYRVPFLHQAMMEPWAVTAHFKDGKLEMWGGLQDPVATRGALAKAAGLSVDAVTFHPMIMGGGFGRRFPPYSQIIDQIAKLAIQLPYPVKLIWSREQEVQHGAYRPQVAARLQGAVTPDGKISAWTSDYAQFANGGDEATVPYTIPSVDIRHHKYISNQVDAYWRSVNASQHGFFNETFVDTLAAAAGKDPYEFRRANLPKGSRHLAVLDAVAKDARWSTPLPAGRARGIAIIESFGSIIAEVVEASMGADGRPKVHHVYAAVDCGTTVNPLNAEAQVAGSIVMGLSACIGEAITLEKGAVVQANFSDYPLLKLAETPEISVRFIESGATMGGLGEPGLPPVAPALANALAQLSGKRITELPMVKA